MPTLADIYSAIDSLKRRGTDAFGHPLDSIMQALGNANDQAREYLNRESEVTEEMRKQGLRSPKFLESSLRTAESFAPEGMTVWHGSPYKFAKFDPAKIGTGEGAQAYGHGLYVAENPNVANEYKRTLGRKNQDIVADALDQVINTNNRDTNKIRDALVTKGFNPDEITPELEKSLKKIVNGTDAQGNVSQSVIKEYDNLKKIVPNTGNLYKIDLPDEHIAKMVDWDAPFSKQPENVKTAFNNISEQNEHLPLDFLIKGDATGGSLMQAMNKIRASELLSNEGVPGIKYLDEGSRVAKSGTRNMVIFPGNEHLLNITDINGNPIQ